MNARQHVNEHVVTGAGGVRAPQQYTKGLAQPFASPDSSSPRPWKSTRVNGHSLSARSSPTSTHTRRHSHSQYPISVNVESDDDDTFPASSYTPRSAAAGPGPSPYPYNVYENPPALASPYDFGFPMVPKHLKVSVEPASNPYFPPVQPSPRMSQHLARARRWGQDVGRKMKGIISRGRSSGVCGLEVFYLVALAFVWYSACVVGTVVSKRLMNGFSYPVSLTCVHLLSAALMDYWWAYQRNIPLVLTKKLILYALPVAGALTFTKCLTYVSYSRVPASLTHTVRAVAPMFSVILTKLYEGKSPSCWVILSLVPISAGVTLSAANEINFNLVGFVAALLSTFTGVLQITYTKATLTKLELEPLVFHMWTSWAALVGSLPLALVSELKPALNGRGAQAAAVQATGTSADRHSAFLLVVISIVAHYAQNIASIYFLSRVNVLTHTVANTLKRLVIITGTVWYFQNTVTVASGVGMIVALSGFFCYGVVKTHHHRRSSRGRKKHGGGYHHEEVNGKPIRSPPPLVVSMADLEQAAAAAGTTMLGVTPLCLDSTSPSSASADKGGATSAITAPPHAVTSASNRGRKQAV